MPGVVLEQVQVGLALLAVAQRVRPLLRGDRLRPRHALERHPVAADQLAQLDQLEGGRVEHVLRRHVEVAERDQLALGQLDDAAVTRGDRDRSLSAHLRVLAGLEARHDALRRPGGQQPGDGVVARRALERKDGAQVMFPWACFADGFPFVSLRTEYRVLPSAHGATLRTGDRAFATWSDRRVSHRPLACVHVLVCSDGDATGHPVARARASAGADRRGRRRCCARPGRAGPGRGRGRDREVGAAARRGSAGADGGSHGPDRAGPRCGGRVRLQRVPSAVRAAPGRAGPARAGSRRGGRAHASAPGLDGGRRPRAGPRPAPTASSGSCTACTG